MFFRQRSGEMDLFVAVRRGFGIGSKSPPAASNINTMKHLSVLLGIAVGFVAPLAAHAEQTALIADTTVPKAKSKADRVVVKAPIPRRAAPHVRYEVTNLTAAGSHIPIVVCHYEGAMYTKGGSFTAKKEYRTEGGTVDCTGAGNLEGGLAGIDPAIR